MRKLDIHGHVYKYLMNVANLYLASLFALLPGALIDGNFKAEIRCHARQKL